MGEHVTCATCAYLNKDGQLTAAFYKCKKSDNIDYVSGKKAQSFCKDKNKHGTCPDWEQRIPWYALLWEALFGKRMCQ